MENREDRDRKTGGGPETESEKKESGSSAGKELLEKNGEECFTAENEKDDFFWDEEAFGPIDEILTKLAYYIDYKMKKEAEMAEIEAMDIQVPPDLKRRMEKTMLRCCRRHKIKVFFRNKARMRALSAVCALFLIFAAGVGIFSSPQSDDLKSELYHLFAGESSGDNNGFSRMDEKDGAISGNGQDADGAADRAEDFDRKDSSGKSSGQDADNRYRTDEGAVSNKTMDKQSSNAGSSQHSDGFKEPNTQPSDSLGDEGQTNGTGNHSSGSGSSDKDNGHPGDSSQEPDPAAFPASLNQVYYPTYVPAGYQRTYVSSEDCIDIVFENRSSQNVITVQCYPQGYDLYEAAADEGRELKVNGNRAVLYYRGSSGGRGQKVLFWNQEGASVRIQADAAGISEEELIRVAESVTLRNTDELKR